MHSMNRKCTRPDGHCPSLWSAGLGLMVKVCGLGFRVWGLGLRVQAVRFGV